MQITNDFGDSYQASEVKVEMVKTILVDAYVYVEWLRGPEVSEEKLKEIAHEQWLEAQDVILRAAEAEFPHIDIEFLSTDNIRIEVVK